MKGYFQQLYQNLKKFFQFLANHNNSDALSSAQFRLHPRMVYPRRRSFFFFKKYYLPYRRVRRRGRSDLRYFRLESYLKLKLLTYIGCYSLDGYRSLPDYYRSVTRAVEKFEFEKIVFEFSNLVDQLLWPWWFFLTTYDLRTEKFKQIFFLHRVSGCLMYMFQLGLAGQMYNEWCENPISGRKQPVWFYLRWRWRHHWHPLWVKINPRMVYRRTILYRLRDFFLNPSGFANRYRYGEFSRQLIRQRYQTAAHSYRARQLSLVVYFRSAIVVTIRRLQNHRMVAMRRLVHRFFRERQRLEKKYHSWNVRLFYDRIERRKLTEEMLDVDVRRWRVLKLLNYFRGFDQTRPVDYVVATPDEYTGYLSARPPGYDHLIDPTPLTLSTVIDDYDFLSDDLMDFEDQQDEPNELDDEGANEDHLFNLSREGFNEEEDELAPGPYTYEWNGSRLRRWTARPFMYPYHHLRRHHGRLGGLEEVVSLNEQASVFDSELDLPCGDGPSVMDDEIDIYEDEPEPLRFFKLIDWFYHRSDNKLMTERNPTLNIMDDLFFWNSSQHHRSVDDLPRGLLAETIAWPERFMVVGKRRDFRLRSRRRQPRRRYRSRWLMRRRRHHTYRLTTRRWEEFHRYGYHQLYNPSPKVKTYHTKGIRLRRLAARLSGRTRDLFQLRHQGVLQPRTAARGRNWYRWRQFAGRLRPSQLLRRRWIQRLQAKSYKQQWETKGGKENHNRESYTRLDLLLNFIYPPAQKVEAKTKRTTSFDYYPDRPTPRRVRLAKHYPRYSPVYRLQTFNANLTGGGRGHDRFSTGLIPGFTLAFLTLILMDGFWYAHDWPAPEFWTFDSTKDPQVYLWWNYDNPDWYRNGFRKFDFFNYQDLMPRDGYGIRRYYPGRFETTHNYHNRRPGIVGRMRWRLMYDLYSHHHPYIHGPTILHHYFSGNEIKPPPPKRDPPTMRLHGHPIPKYVYMQDKYNFDIKVLFRFEHEYLKTFHISLRRRRRWNKFLFHMWYKFYMRSQFTELLFFNSYNRGRFDRYIMDPPRALYGDNPIRVSPRAEATYQPFLDNLVYSQYRNFAYRNYYCLGHELDYTVPRRPRRFDKFYLDGLPVWEQQVNSACLQHWRGESMAKFDHYTRPDRPPAVWADLLTELVQGLEVYFYLFWSAWVYPLRIFLLVGFPWLFMRWYRPGYLYWLSLRYHPALIQPHLVARAGGLAHPVQPRPTFTAGATRRYRRVRLQYYPARRRRLLRRRRRWIRLRRPEYLVYQPHMRGVRRLRGYKLGRSNLGRRAQLHSRHLRTYHHRYRRDSYQGYRHHLVRGGYQRRSRLDERWAVANRARTLQSLRQDLNLHRSTPTRRRRLDPLQPRLITRNFQPLKPRPPMELTLSRPSAVLNYGLRRSIVERKTLDYRRGRPRQHWAPHRPAGHAWLIRPRRTLVDQPAGYHLSREPNQSEFNRRSTLEVNKRGLKEYETYENNPELVSAQTFFRYDRSQRFWLRYKVSHHQRTSEGQNLNLDIHPAESDRNLHFKNLIEDKARFVPRPPVPFRVGCPSHVMGLKLQHRYHLQTYLQNLTPLVSVPTPLVHQPIYDLFLTQLAECTYPGATLAQPADLQPRVAAEYDHTDLDEHVYGGDSDEDEGELTLEEHDSLFTEYESFEVLETYPAQLVSVADRLSLSVEHRRRALLASYRRFRSLPIEHYGLRAPLESYSADHQVVGEIYFGPLAVDHPGYEQLSLTTYGIPDLYRRLIERGRTQTKILQRLKPVRTRTMHHRYFFRWTRQPRLAQHHNLHPNRRRRYTNVRSRVSLSRRHRLEPDWPVVHPGLTVDLQPELWGLAHQVVDHLYLAGSAQVDTLEATPDWALADEECANFFDQSLSFNGGYRWGGERLYSLLQLRPNETRLAVLDRPLVFEHGLNPDRELAAEDLNYPAVRDYESAYLEYLCGHFSEGYSLFNYFFESNPDVNPMCEWLSEDEDEIDEWDDLSETPDDPDHLPKYLPLAALAHGGLDPRSGAVHARLNPHAVTVISDGFDRIPAYQTGIRHYTRLSQLTRRDADLNRRYNRHDDPFLRDVVELIFMRPKLHIFHHMMETGVDIPNETLGDRDVDELILKMWALSDSYYADVPQGYTIGY